MTRLPTQTEKRYKTPTAMQFSIFLANRVGQLKEMLDFMVSQDVAIVGLSIVDSTDWAVIRLVFQGSEKGKAALRKHNTPFTESEVLLVRLSGQDSMAAICGLLLRAEINVHFAYPLIVQHQGLPIMVFHVDDLGASREVLLRHHITLLGEEDLSPGLTG